MGDPLIAQKAPYPQDLAPGEYWWCACGRSAKQPYCDGSHKGTDFMPVRFTVAPGAGKQWLCGCKHSKRKPFCDGTHNKIGK